MATKKTNERIFVNGIFGDEVQELKGALESLEEQYKLQRQMLISSLQTALRLARKAEGVPDEYQFDLDTMEFIPAPEPVEEADNGLDA